MAKKTQYQFVAYTYMHTSEPTYLSTYTDRHTDAHTRTHAHHVVRAIIHRISRIERREESSPNELTVPLRETTPTEIKKTVQEQKVPGNARVRAHVW